jgi:hypothetical protein
MAEESTKSPAKAARRRSPLVWLLVVALLAAVGWLVADRNARQWWLVPEDGRLVVKKGVLFVTGKATFKSDDPELSRTYAPVAPPAGVTLAPERPFDDRSALDQALFALLARWARDDIQSEQPQRIQEARGYLQRAARLAGTSAAQRDELRSLQGETAFYQAAWDLEQGAESLRRAAEQLRMASETRGPIAAEAMSLGRTLEPVLQGANQAALEASRFASERHARGAPAAAPGPASPGGPVPAEGSARP